MADNAVWKAAKPFATGSLAGMAATTCIQPVDMVKVRIQLLAGTAEAVGPVTIASNMLKNEGVAAFYKGLDAGLTRQVVYTGARLGLFDKFTGMVKQPGKPLSFVENAGCALSAGGLAALLGNPADLALIRMQADSMKPAAERAGYTGVVTTMGKIVASDGVGGLMAGAGPTAARAMALNFGMLAFNASAKDALAGAGVTGAPQVFGASAIAGFFASFFSLPFDFVKSQMQSQKPDAATGQLPYKSSIDCVMQIMKQGGPLRFYAGFPTFYVRIAPHAMITLIAQDAIKKGWSKVGL
uniref:Mitochondrial 2-oxoglutarate/malate translocator n=1 Tax=Karlodinium veneficum TaxID=407301 RepID=F2WQ63_KARVE|nr:mitochondrial 2-oxoglutarate/malate translocator [Karlodinium veneficum]